MGPLRGLERARDSEIGGLHVGGERSNRQLDSLPAVLLGPVEVQSAVGQRGPV